MKCDESAVTYLEIWETQSLRERNIVSQDIRKGGIAVLALERSCADNIRKSICQEVHQSRRWVSTAFDNLCAMYSSVPTNDFVGKLAMQ